MKPLDMARQFNVSRRTAQRWIKAGRTAQDVATASRRIGGDGKTYTVWRRSYPPQVSRAVTRLGYAVNSLDRLACSQGITSSDAVHLATVADHISEMLARWRDTFGKAEPVV